MKSDLASPEPVTNQHEELGCRTPNWIHRIKFKLANRFIRNMSWLGGSQLANRVLRILATVVVARLLGPEDYGLAAIALTAHEFIQMLGRHGVVAKLVQAPEHRLETLAQSAYWLNWVQGVLLFICQCIMAWVLSQAFDNPALLLPICILGLSYFMLPFGIVQAALTLRENRLHITATVEALQCATDLALMVVMAWFGWGFWALVLPKVLVVPIWVVVYRKYQHWRPSGSYSLSDWREILRFSLPITGVEVLSTLRNNADYLLIGYILGVKALGIYYFAFNAGLGISLSLISALGNAFFPHLCEVSHSADKLRLSFISGLKSMSSILLPLILLQTVLAPIYLPIVFGQKWLDAGALPVLMLICLSALPRPFAEAASQLLRAVGQPQLEFQANIILTVLLLTSLSLGIFWGINGVATSVMLAHWLALPPFAIWASHRVFKANVSQA